MTWWDMVKFSVALIAVLAMLGALAGPAAADSPEGEPPGQDPGSGQDPADPSEPPSEGEPSGNSTADPDESARATGCPLVYSYAGDPNRPVHQWVVLDPKGCYNELIKRALGIPPIERALHRLP